MKQWMGEPEVKIEIITDWKVGEKIIVKGEAVREAHNPRISLRQIVTSRATARIDRVSFFLCNQEFSGRHAHGAHFVGLIEIDTFPLFPNDTRTSKKIECRSSI